ncbi:MAG: helix-turn-helix transcriptional regulator [Thermomicrobiales bacterium]|nr:helix-turn-helix transcriptional regulator [Thermomicrobiales bacterium]
MHVDTEALKRLRIEAGLSLRGLAVAAGVSHDTAMEIEAGKRTPHPATVKKLATALGVSVGALVDWEAEGIEQGKAVA